MLARMVTFLRLLFNLVLLAAGLVLATSFAFAFALFAIGWVLRSVWARLTGRPATPFVVRVDPRQGFRRMYRHAQAPSRTPRADAVARHPAVGDIVDVEPKT